MHDIFNLPNDQLFPDYNFFGVGDVLIILFHFDNMSLIPNICYQFLFKNVI